MTRLFDDGFGLLLSRDDRARVWDALRDEVEAYLSQVEDLPVPQRATRRAVRDRLDAVDLEGPRDPAEVVRWAAGCLRDFQLHTTHPAYYGVFNPNPSSMSLPAEALAAAFNPQLASSASSMFCIEVEDYLVRLLGGAFGYASAETEGVFTSGGTEANYTALLAALAAGVEGWRARGLRALEAWPRIYCTAESHHSFRRAARVAGLGTDAVVEVAVTPGLTMDVGALRAAIAADRAAGEAPRMVVGTLGTTSAGVIDPLDELAEVAAAEGLWFHVDGAWGGAAALLPEFAGALAGLARADSVTLDPHKWLSVAMGCGMYVTRHRGSLRRTFGLERSVYMPDETYAEATTEPYRETMQWSRRFTGLKLWMTVMTHGLAGYRGVLRHQVAMGEYLKGRLRVTGWEVLNDTPLPVACFRPAGEPDADIPALLAAVNAAGDTWITDTVLRYDGAKCLRVGISNFATQREHVDVVVARLAAARGAG